MKSINLLWTLISLLLILVVISFFTTLFNQSNDQAELDSKAYCGTVNDVFIAGPKGEEHYISGKKLFKDNCAACHHKNMNYDMAGPALKGALGRWETIQLE